MHTLNNFKRGHSWIRSSLGTYIYIWKFLLSSISISRAYHMHLLTSGATVYAKELGCGMERWVWYLRRQAKKVVALKSFTLFSAMQSKHCCLL
jgi:hypothetical protein